MISKLSTFVRAAFATVAFLMLSGFAAPLAAQNPFQPVIKVGDRVITAFDVQQRTLFLTLLNAGSDPGKIAREQLVTEAIQFMAANRDGIVLPEAAIVDAQTNFAAQGNFERDPFIAALAEQGVEEGTFRNFVSAGLIWRETVRNRFGPRIEVTDIDIDRALARVPAEAGTRILISEIIMPAADPLSEAASIARANRIRQTTDEFEFSNAARLFSVSPSRFQGGEVGWRPLEVLPEDAAKEIVRLSPGQVTSPTRFGETIAIFQLRDREEVAAGSVDVVSADYAEYLIPGGQSAQAQSEAADLLAKVRTCDDLYGVVQKEGKDRLTRHLTRISELPSDVARELTLLDNYEVSTNLTRGGNMVFLMLCERTVRESAAVDRQLVQRALTNQRLESFAAGYLNELRLATEITEIR